jgi:two-component system nitrate/nitrite response regulator NarL
MIHILIADVDPAARKALSLLLRRKLCMDDVYEVGDVESLSRALANTPPELLLLDGKLYGSPPLETCRLLKKAFPPLKIVLLSLDAKDEEIARSAGVDFIHKGSAPDAIILKLTSLLYQDSLCLTKLE